MARYIDADALLKHARKMSGADWGGEFWDEAVLTSDIKNAPTIEARPVVRGEWEPRKDVIGFVRCSVCHDCNIYDDWPDGKKWNFCPNCGADMRGDGDETD